MDTLTAAAGLAALASAGAGWHWRRRARRSEIRAAHLHSELQAERHAARHDPLTGLPNRRAFYQLGAELIADPIRPPLVVVLLDLDEFKRINDVYGHAAGDEVLATIAERFARYAGDNLVARLGGDEFVGLLRITATDPRHPDRDAHRLAELLAAPMHTAGRQLTVTASVGMAPVRDCTSLAEALHRADAAMYIAKARRGHAVDGFPYPDIRPWPDHVAPAGHHHDACTDRRLTMPAPTIDPDERDPAGIAPTDSYRPADTVWIYRADRWHPGVIEAASARAATITYRPTDAGGTSVDTLTARYLIVRTDLDAILDRHPSRSDASRG